MKNFYFLAVAVYLLVGCTKSEEPNYSQNAKKRTFSVSLENNQTRAHAENLSVVWDNGDLMSILEGGSNFQYKYDASKQDIFAVNGAAGDGEVYAVYPYAESNVVVDDVISLTFPAEQNYYAESFGLGANTMVAKSSDDNLSFKNVGSYLKLYLWGDDVTVQSITLKGNSDAAQLSGTALVSFDSNGLPVYEWDSDVEDGSKTITLNCPSGVTLGTSEDDATPFWIVVPPQTFTGGFTITVTDIEGKGFVQSTAKNVVLDRNYVQPMTAIEVVPTQPADEVWYYDENGVKHILDIDESGSLNMTNFLPIEIPNDILNPDMSDPDFIERQGIVRMVIPDGITSIDLGAFAYCMNLESVKLPSTLKSIGYGAFGACMKLTSIDIPEGVEIIGEGAFLMSGLQSVTIPSSVTKIGMGAFSQSALKEIVIEEGTGELVLDIGAFQNCPMLESVTIPSNVKEITDSSFSGCVSLSSVTLAEGIEVIGPSAFDGCESLESITLPEGLVRIEAQAFARSGIKEIVVPDGTKIDNQAFMYSSLEKITLPSQMTEIAMETFMGCENLSEIDFNGAKITKIGHDAFSGCTSWTDFDFEYVEVVETNAFSGCNLGDLVIDTSSPNGVVLEQGAFHNCGATSVTLGEGVKAIHKGCFGGSTDRLDILKWISVEATTPPWLEDVSAFHQNNHSLTTIYVPAESLLEYKVTDVWEDLPYTNAGRGDYKKEPNGNFNFKHYPFEGSYDYRVDENNQSYYEYVGWNGNYSYNEYSGKYEYVGEEKGAYILVNGVYNSVGAGNGDYVKLPAEECEYVEVGIGHGNYRIGKNSNGIYTYIKVDSGEGDYIYKEYVYVGAGNGDYELTSGEFEKVGGKGSAIKIGENYQDDRGGVPGVSYDEYRKKISIVAGPSPAI